jgi:hypothetical protein
MNLEQIQEMWEKDSKIDPDNLHDESLKIPQLHSKYYTLYNTITLLRERAREQYAKVRLERYNYYTGKATAEVYAEEPFPYKVREKDAIQRHLEADDKMNKIDMKIKYYDVMLKFLEEIIRAVSNRTYQIKNAIEWNKFQAGYESRLVRYYRRIMKSFKQLQEILGGVPNDGYFGHPRLKIENPFSPPKEKTKKTNGGKGLTNKLGNRATEIEDMIKNMR